MAGFTLFDVGACGCTTLCGAPCPLPQSNLGLNWTDGAGDSGSVSIVYTGLSGSLYNWAVTACQATPSNATYGSFKAFVTCNKSTGETKFIVFFWNQPNTFCISTQNSFQTWSSASGGSITLTSHTCSPLNLVFTYAGYTWTVTI